MTRFFASILAGAVLVSSAGRACAWNSIGHMAVAKLAYDQLEGKQQIALYRLLQSHPHYKTFLSASRPAAIDNEVEWVVLRSAIWPDWIRPRKKDMRGIDVAKYHRGEEHYINVPLINPKDERFFAGKTLVSPDLANIVSALKQRSNDLRTKNAALEDRAVAACWLFHLVGDIHQPLHNVAYFSSDKGFVGGDLGGNKFGIKADGRKWRLHTFWDDLIGTDRDYADDSVAHQGTIYDEAVKAAQSLRGLKLMDADKDKLAKNTTFESWSRESYELAKTVGYQKSDGSGMLKAVEVKFDGEISDNVEEVGKEYIQIARATAGRQVFLAGRRLAERIKMLLPP
jgi:hypothetical protein